MEIKLPNQIIQRAWGTECRGGIIVEVSEDALLPIPVEYPSFPYLQVSEDKSHTWVGRVLQSSKKGDFVVLKWVREDNKHNYYNVQSLLNGYTHVVPDSSLHSAKIGNPYLPTNHGVGYFGCIEVKCDLYPKIKSIWSSMLSRCYNKSNCMYPNYGGRGVYVDNRWLSLENFYKDCKDLLGWDKKLKDWGYFSLDKDILGNGLCYSKGTCMFLGRKDQTLNVQETPFVKVTTKEGRCLIYPSLAGASQHLAIPTGNLCSVKGSRRASAGCVSGVSTLLPYNPNNRLKWLSKEVLWMLRKDDINWNIFTDLLDKLGVKY